MSIKKELDECVTQLRHLHLNLYQEAILLPQREVANLISVEISRLQRLTQLLEELHG